MMDSYNLTIVTKFSSWSSPLESSQYKPAIKLAIIKSGRFGDVKYMGNPKQKSTFEHAQNAHSHPVHAQHIILAFGLCSSVIHSVVSSNSVSEQ